MRPAFYALLLFFAVAVAPFTSDGAPLRPSRSGSAIILQDGTHARITNGKLMLVTPNGKQSPAPVGQYITRDGRSLTVGNDGRVSVNSRPVNARTAPDVQPSATPVAAGKHDSMPRTQSPFQTSTVGQPPVDAQTLGNPRDIPVIKTPDFCLIMFEKIVAKLDALEAKHAECESEIMKQLAELKESELTIRTKLNKIEQDEKYDHQVAAQVSKKLQSDLSIFINDNVPLIKNIHTHTEILPTKFDNSQFPAHRDSNGKMDYWLTMYQLATHIESQTEHLSGDAEIDAKIRMATPPW